MRLVRLPMIIVNLFMVLALIVMYLRNGLVMTVGAWFSYTVPRLARTYVKSWAITLHFNSKLLSVFVLV